MEETSDDLLQKNDSTCKIVPDDDEAMDGGARAWLVMVCSFCCNGILFGVINSSGVFHKELSEHLEAMNDTEASSKAGE